MTPRVLALNPGSSSLKAALRSDRLELTALVERVATPRGSLTVDGETTAFTGDLSDAVQELARRLPGPPPDVVAHRIVHGGPRHQEHLVLDDAVLADLHAAVPLAPLHLPGALAVIDVARRIWPDAEHIGCLDTAFFRDLPESSRRLPVAAELADLGVRRYGFHGLSVESVLHAKRPLGNVVVAHLGSGCSITAVDAQGRPRHNTMSMTPSGGMMSATRTGDLDPEIVLNLIEQHGYSPRRLRELVNTESGLAGIASGRHDLRDLLSAGDPAAVLALEMFTGSAAMAVAACATRLPGWDSLVFTGGVGEHVESIRTGVVERVRPPAGVEVLVVPAEEELEMDAIARRLATPPG